MTDISRVIQTFTSLLNDRNIENALNLARNVREFQQQHGLRDDWHEPDEQEVECVVIGNHLDNAFGNARMEELLRSNSHEYLLELFQGANTQPLRINLANLLAAASNLVELIDSIEEALDLGPKPPQARDYSYGIYWEHEDEVFIGTVDQFPSIKAHGDTPDEALEEVMGAVAGVLEDMKETGEKPPRPRSQR